MKILSKENAELIANTNHEDDTFDIYEFLESNGCVTLPFKNQEGKTLYFFQYFYDIPRIIELRWNEETHELWLFSEEDKDEDREEEIFTITMPDLKCIISEEWSILIERSRE